MLLASETNPLPAMTFAEVLDTSDVPGGVVNILTGQVDELAEYFASHREIRGLVIDHAEVDRAATDAAAADNLKHVHWVDPKTDWTSNLEQDPYRIQDHMEIKTTWHPVGV